MLHSAVKKHVNGVVWRWLDDRERRDWSTVLIVNEKPRPAAQYVRGKVPCVGTVSTVHHGAEKRVLGVLGVVRVRGRRAVELWQHHGVLGREIPGVFRRGALGPGREGEAEVLWKGRREIPHMKGPVVVHTRALCVCFVLVCRRGISLYASRHYVFQDQFCERACRSVCVKLQHLDVVACRGLWRVERHLTGATLEHLADFCVEALGNRASFPARRCEKLHRALLPLEAQIGVVDFADQWCLNVHNRTMSNLHRPNKLVQSIFAPSNCICRHRRRAQTLQEGSCKTRVAGVGNAHWKSLHGPRNHRPHRDYISSPGIFVHYQLLPNLSRI